jgi:hypothetical protein
MIGTVTSVSFSWSRQEAVRSEHTHIPNGCSCCQPKSEKTPTPTQTTDTTESSTTKHRTPNELTEEEKQQVEALKARDREVRLHEQAHLAAAGAHARGGPSFSYQQGPDGKQYAVGGEVPIDLSPVSGNPRATIQKAETIQRAALAPADPSGPDRRVAAQAAALAAKARQEIAQQSQETTNEGKKFAADSSMSFSEGIYFPSHGVYRTQEQRFPSSSLEEKNSSQKQRHTQDHPGALLNVFA